MQKKKHLHQENHQNIVEIIDQQNEPFLRSLQKRVRNINKKLNQISELEQKQERSLKPEQLEKINRKQNLLEEKARLEETAAHYKEVVAENAEYYRTIQLKELESLAKAINVYHLRPEFPQYQRLSQLWSVLTQKRKGVSLLSAITATVNSLNEFANDRKLQKSLNTFVVENRDKVQIVNCVDKEQNEQKPDTFEVVEEQTVAVITQEYKNQKGETEIIEVIDRVENGIQNITVNITTQNSKEIIHQTKENNIQITSTPIPSLNDQNNSQILYKEACQHDSQGIRQDKVQNQHPTEYNEDKNKQSKGKGHKIHNNYEEKREIYKPKYQPRQQKQDTNENQKSQSSSSSEKRKFKQEQLRKLQEEGFIVVGGKPKHQQTNQGKRYTQPRKDRRT